MRDLVGRTVDRYEVGPLLGQGGFGAVYRAKHAVLEREVALKVLWPDRADDPSVVERTLREARAAASIGSERICRVSDAGIADDGVVFLALELLEGEDLAAVIGRGAVPLAEATRVVDQILEGLSAAHGQAIVHRDLKPSNVFVTERGDVKLLDFGISKILGARSLTERGMAIGTPRYMAPEQLAGQPVDARADLWAAGAILHELLRGASAYEGGGFDLMVRRVKGEPAAPLTDHAPPAVVAVVERAMARAPSDRWPSAGAFRRALEAAVEGRPIPDVDATIGPEVSPLSGPVIAAAAHRDPSTPPRSIPPTAALPSVPPKRADPDARTEPALPIPTGAPPRVEARGAPWAWIGLATLALLLATALGMLGVLAVRYGAREEPPARAAVIPHPPPPSAPVAPAPVAPAPVAPAPALPPPSTPEPERELLPPWVPTPADPSAIRFEMSPSTMAGTAAARGALSDHLDDLRVPLSRCARSRPMSTPVMITAGPASVQAIQDPGHRADDPLVASCVLEAIREGGAVGFRGPAGVAGTVFVHLPAGTPVD